MKAFVVTVAATALLLGAQAQTYSGPESVEYDAANGRYLVSNSSNGQILARDDASGTLSIFASGLSAGPHGLEIMGNTVYACSGGRIKGYDLTSGNEVFDLNLNGSFLNGITNDGTCLFVTDFSAKKIYRVIPASNSYNEMTSTAATPNGIIYDGANNRLVFIEWGGNADVNAVSLTDSTTTELAATSLGNLDGIAMNSNGDFFISAWSDNSIHAFNNDFTLGPSQVVTGLSNPADIYYNQANDTLASPNSGSNTVTFHNMAAITGLDEAPVNEIKASLFPNPAAETVVIEITGADDGRPELELFEMSGRKVEMNYVNRLNGDVRELQMDVSELTEGNYFVRVKLGSEIQTLKFQVKH